MPYRLQFVNKREYIDIEGDKIPHWNQPNCVQFVTFRLADSMPQTKLKEYRKVKEQWLSMHPKPWDEDMQEEYDKTFTAVIDKWLDANYGECFLKDKRVREIVDEALMHSDGERYDMYAYVIMPNHVHVLMTPLGDNTVQSIMGTWKRYSSGRINALLRREGAVWERECFDHLVRNADEFEAYIGYIADNPNGMPEHWYSLFVRH